MDINADMTISGDLRPEDKPECVGGLTSVTFNSRRSDELLKVCLKYKGGDPMDRGSYSIEEVQVSRKEWFKSWPGPIPEPHKISIRDARSILSVSGINLDEVADYLHRRT